MQVGIKAQPESQVAKEQGISSSEKTTSPRSQPTLQFEELVHHLGPIDKTQNPQSQLYAYVGITPEVVTVNVPTQDEIVYLHVRKTDDLPSHIKG